MDKLPNSGLGPIQLEGWGFKKTIQECWEAERTGLKQERPHGNAMIQQGLLYSWVKQGSGRVPGGSGVHMY